MFEEKKKACVASIGHLIAASEILIPWVPAEDREEFEMTVKEMKEGLIQVENATDEESLNKIMDI